MYNKRSDERTVLSARTVNWKCGNTRGLSAATVALAVGLLTHVAGAAIIPADRSVPWAPGVPGGIPERNVVFADVKINFGAVGNDIADDTAAIQAAINACPSNQVVYLPPGTYRVTKTIVITRSIVLRGAGPALTRIRMYEARENIIRVGNWAGIDKTEVTGGMNKGSKSIAVASAAAFNVGDFALIDQTNDNRFVDNVQQETWLSRDSGTRCIGQVVKIVGKSGNNLTTEAPLYFTFVPECSPQLLKLASTVLQYAGVEDLCVEPKSTNVADSIRIMHSAYCWVKNVESDKAGCRHIQVRRSYRCEVRECYAHDGMTYGSGSAYGISLFDRATATLVTDNILYHLTVGVQLEAGPVGNVISYNFQKDNYGGSSWLNKGIGTHGAHPYMNLMEGNKTQAFSFDYVHGSSSHNTLFRNHVTREANPPEREIIYSLRAMEMDKWNRYFNIVGNVFGLSNLTWTAYEDNGTRLADQKYVYTWGYGFDNDTTCDDPLVKETTLRHGNYDFCTASTVWDPGISDHALPDSLYLSSKPAFFGDLAWPPFGPDRQPMIGTLPAERRFLGKATTRPAPPRNPVAR